MDILLGRSTTTCIEVFIFWWPIGVSLRYLPLPLVTSLNILHHYRCPLDTMEKEDCSWPRRSTDFSGPRDFRRSGTWDVYVADSETHLPGLWLYSFPIRARPWGGWCGQFNLLWGWNTPLNKLCAWTSAFYALRVQDMTMPLRAALRARCLVHVTCVRRWSLTLSLSFLIQCIIFPDNSPTVLVCPIILTPDLFCQRGFCSC